MMLKTLQVSELPVASPHALMSLQFVAEQKFPVKTISVYNMLTYLKPVSTLCP